MKFFVDTAEIDQIKELNDLGMVDGVTTNPSLIMKSGRDIIEVTKEICSIVSGPVSAEVTATDAETMIAEGRKLVKIADNITVKVPLTWDGLKACKVLSSEGHKLNVTLCFSVNQAILAAKAGATFISPFVGRLDDINLDGLELIEDIRTVYDNYGFGTEILAASIRTTNHIADCARIGADVILLKGVILGENVGFDSFINVPAGVMLTDTLSKIAVPGQATRTALDLRSKPMAGASQSPRTSYLELVNEEVQTSVPGAKLEQAVDGAVRMEFESSESRLVPVAIRKTEDEPKGFHFDDDGNLSIRLGENLEIIMYPMFNDEAGLKEQLDKDYPALSLDYDEDSNFVITGEGKTGTEATLPRYIGRAGLSAVKAYRSTEEGFVLYPNPLLRNLMLVSFVSRNEAGELMEQTMSPVPKDWFRFKERLLREPDVDSIKISSLGLITVVYKKELWQLMASYDILPNAAIPSENRPIVFINAGDLNDDGEVDYYAYYPNGDRQTIYIVPR